MVMIHTIISQEPLKIKVFVIQLVIYLIPGNILLVHLVLG